ncbi:MAG: division/cell wall cluster transcriptional repressor MraZ [Planctomycetales bacterium]
MVLSGTIARTLDEKQRVAVPKRLLDDFGETDLASLFVAPGTEKSLLIYSPAGFERLARRMAKKTSQPAQVRHFKRLFYSRAERVDLDAQGRIRIPERLVDFALLKRDVVLLGVQDHMELWDAAAWSTFLEQTSAGFDQIADAALE